MRPSTIIAALILTAVCAGVAGAAIGFLRWTCENKWPAARVPMFNLEDGCTIIFEDERVPAFFTARIDFR